MSGTGSSGTASPSAWRTNLDDSDFAYLTRLLNDATGNLLSEERRAGVESRLWNLARAKGFESLAAVIREHRRHPTREFTDRIIEALLNGETLFFRDAPFFKALKEKLLPELIRLNQSTSTLRFWSAACASGQEPYSLAMLLLEAPELVGWTVRIFASDLSLTSIARAMEARYSQTEVNRGLPARYLVRYFEESDGRWGVCRKIRDAVEFQHVNLIESWPARYDLDGIFLRNVLIYFDRDAKISVLERARDALKPGGYLILGGSESNLEGVSGLERVVIAGIAGCYRRAQRLSAR